MRLQGPAVQVAQARLPGRRSLGTGGV